MTSLWNIGSDLDSITEAMKHVPTFQFDARPLPEKPELRMQCPKGDVLEKIWTEQGCYCPVCYSVSRDLGVFAALREGEDPQKDSIYINWHVVLRELVAAAEKGCVFCGFMLCEFFNDPGYTFVYVEGSVVQSNQITCCIENLDTPRSGKLQKAIDRTRGLCDQLQKDDEPWVRLIAQPVDYSAEDGKFGKVRFQAGYSNLNKDEILKVLGLRREIVLDLYYASEASAAFLKYLPPMIDLGNEFSFDYAQKWIMECANEHTECPEVAKTMLPTRVVEIVSQTEIRLCSDRIEEFYATLSYCWGGPQSFATTQETVQGRQKGFSVEDLPATLRDAISVTLNIGLKYLWVDSLCIIQDSEEDKERELAMMADYYKNSFVTICVGGHTCSKEFLVKRGECKEHPGHLTPAGLLPLQVLSPQGKVGQLLYGKESLYTWSQEAIADRAWTLQEYILSPRALMYGNRLVWQCNSAQYSAGGVEEWAADVRKFDYASVRARVLQAVTQVSHDDSAPTDTDSLVDLWHQIVHEYSYRKLSFQHDKFPALSALANQFQTILQTDYLAGLWRRYLLRGLMWSTFPDLNPTRANPWRAPSWSWASCEGVISFNNLPSKEAREVAEVVKCTIIPKSSLVPYGEITEAELEIKGFLLKFPKDITMNLLRRNNQMPRQVDSADWRSNLSDFAKRGMGNRPGTEEWEVPENHVLLVLFEQTQKLIGDQIKTYGETEGSVLSGLVLVPVEGGKYERIARFTELKVTGYKQIVSEATMQIVSLV